MADCPIIAIEWHITTQVATNRYHARALEKSCCLCIYYALAEHIITSLPCKEAVFMNLSQVGRKAPKVSQMNMLPVSCYLY